MSERYYNSRQSNLNKHGEPLDHWIARCRIKGILEKMGFTVYCFPEEEQPKEAKLTVTFKLLDFSYTKAFDIVAIKIFPKTGMKTTLIIEVDGGIHNTKNQKWKDNFARKITEAVIDNLEYVRIEKDYILNENISDEDIIKTLHLDFYNRYQEVL